MRYYNNATKSYVIDKPKNNHIQDKYITEVITRISNVIVNSAMKNTEYNNSVKTISRISNNNSTK